MSTVFCPLQLPTAITIIIQRPETITGLALSCGFFSPSYSRSLVHSLVLHGPDLASLHISIHLSILRSATYLVYPSILVSDCWSLFPPLSLFLLYLLTLATTIFSTISPPLFISSCCCSCCCIFVWLRVIPSYINLISAALVPFTHPSPSFPGPVLFDLLPYPFARCCNKVVQPSHQPPLPSPAYGTRDWDCIGLTACLNNSQPTNLVAFFIPHSHRGSPGA